jgi:hypothetical protein
MKPDLLTPREHLDRELSLDGESPISKDDLQCALADTLLESKP